MVRFVKSPALAVAALAALTLLAIGCANATGAPTGQQGPGPSACEAGMFTCGNGNCIAIAGVCNNVDECGDGSDEVDCSGGGTNNNNNQSGTSAACFVGQLDCGNGSCVDADDLCDGFDDCPGSSADEDGCGGIGEACETGFFECGPGQCVPAAQRCNQTSDCANGADEAGCGSKTGGGNPPPPPPPPPSCDAGTQFTCGNGACIENSQVCNGPTDCTDGSDEADCGCDESQFFECADGSCLPWEAFCTGAPNCPGNEDESPGACTVNEECSFSEFECNDHSCRPLFFKCDGTPDCPFGEDELGC